MLEVFATSRAIRSFYDTFIETNQLLPKAITIAEFEQKAVLVPNHQLVDDDMRVLLMQEATHFTKYELLHIEREFFTFLKNSTYLFRFFEELAHEKVPLGLLQGADTYAHFAEHLEVLSTLLKHYKALLSKHALFDRITLPECYELNSAYIQSLGSVCLHVEGFLSRFEVELLTNIATLIPLHVKLSITAYNHKMIKLFEELGITLQENYAYEINLSSKEILHVNALKSPKQNVQTYGFGSRLAQVGFVQNTIAQFVEEGLSPEEIVVVLPDEHFSESLHNFDTYHNLNFAMGISLKNTVYYQRLSAVEKAFRYDDIEDVLRLNRHHFEEELRVTCKEKWHQKLEAKEALGLLESLLDYDAIKEKNPLLQEVLFHFTHFLNRAPALRFEQVVRLFLNRLSAQSSDDVRGGKITVLGLLETRGVRYRGVIIVDFNDEFIPKRSQKDLFLSSALRAHVGLPTKKDRENLQRYYYQQLLYKADKVAISYVHNELSLPSRFLDELGFHERTVVDDTILAPHFFKPQTPKIAYDEAFIDAPYDLLASPLSATKLRVLLTCKRQFYFRYILNLKEAKMPTNIIDEQSLGVRLHAVLEEVMCDAVLLDSKVLKEQIRASLKAQNAHEVWHYFADMWTVKLEPFIENEIKRFEAGYHLFKKEFSHTIPYNGFILEGKIDRIDIRHNKLSIIDYKSGKVPTTTSRSLEQTVDFQLVFYSIIAQSLGEVEGVYYYDLKAGTLIEEPFLAEKKTLLDEKLLSLKAPINGYEKCEELKHCRLCPYALLCQREEG